MLQLFRTNSIVSFGLLMIYIVLLRVAYFLKPLPLTDHDGGYLFHIFQSQWQNSITISFWTATFLLITTAVYITRLGIMHITTTSKTVIPGAVMAILGSVSLLYFPLAPYHFAGLFMVFVLGNFLNLQSIKDTSLYHFNIGFHIAFGSMFFAPLALFIPYLMIRQSSMGKPTFESQVQLLTGLAVALGLVMTYAFMTDSLHLFWQLQWTNGLYFLKNLTWFDDLSQQITTIFFFLCFAFAFFKFGTMNLSRSLTTKRKISVIYEFLLIATLIAFFQKDSYVTSFLLPAPILALIIGMSFSEMKKVLVGELIYMLMLIVLLFSHFYISY